MIYFVSKCKELDRPWILYNAESVLGKLFMQEIKNSSVMAWRE